MERKPVKIFVSGTYEILHGGHVQFFDDARRLGDHLTVSFASDAVLLKYKGRKAAIPEAHRRKLLESLKMVDEVVMGDFTDDPILDFKDHFLKIQPDMLVATTDDKFALRKAAFCEVSGAKYVQLPKSLSYPMISTTEIRQNITRL